MKMRLALPRLELERIARLRDLRTPPEDGGSAGNAPHAPQLMQIGAIRIVRLVDVARACEIGSAQAPARRVALARELLHERASQVVRVNDVSAAVGLHRVQLSREFRRWFGMPMMAYLYDLRLERAVTEMATTTRSLSRIAVAHGFSDHAHFTRRFAVSLGITPSKLRKLMQASSPETAHDAWPNAASF